jgi:hypothetical protein
MTDIAAAAENKEFQAALVVPLPDGGYGPADGNQLLGLASQALAAIISRDAGGKVWRLDSQIQWHPKMNSAPGGLLESIYFTGHASYRVLNQTDVVRLMCGAEIFNAGADNIQTLLYAAFKDSFYWQLPHSELLVSGAMQSIDQVLASAGYRATWHMVAGSWLRNPPFSGRCVMHPGGPTPVVPVPTRPRAVIPAAHIAGTRQSREFPIPWRDVIDLLPTVCNRLQFRGLDVQQRTKTATASLRQQVPAAVRINKELHLLFRWEQRGPKATAAEWSVTNGPMNIPDMPMTLNFGGVLGEEYERVWGSRLRRREGLRPSEEGRPARRRDQLWLGPGETLKAPFHGEIFDYSGCATVEELKAFRSGDLPLGRWAFTRDGTHTKHGPMLYLPLRRKHSDELLMHRGVVLCAPPRAGKTMLLLMWARAANRKGYSSLIVDVKGDMLEKLGRLNGKVLYLTTNTAAGKRGRRGSDRLNLLGGLDESPDGGHAEVAQLVEALLPDRAYEGEGVDRLAGRKGWLTSLIHLVRIYAYYDRKNAFGGRTPDLGDVYEAAADERRLVHILNEVRRLEKARMKSPPVIGIGRGVEPWLLGLAALLPKSVEGGQREDKETLQSTTWSLLAALGAFAPTSPLRRRTGDLGDGRLFSLEDLVGDEQVTLIIEAREQETTQAEILLAVIVAKLQYLLFNRFPKKTPRKLLLLLDETRRIRSFKPDQYFSFAAAAKAGCVVVYQALEHACDGDERRIRAMLASIGTHVYLGALEGMAADYVISRLGRRTRTIHEPIPGAKLGGPRSIRKPVDVEYLGIKELRHLAAGKFPALVLCDEHSKKPFMVDTEQVVAKER